MQINSRMTRSGEEVATRTLHAVLAVVALGVFVFSGAPVLAQDGTAQPERWWLDRAEEIEQFMRDAEVVDIEDIGEGVTNPKRAELAPGGPVRRITFKPIRPAFTEGSMTPTRPRSPPTSSTSSWSSQWSPLWWRSTSVERLAQPSCGWNRQRASRRWEGFRRKYLDRRPHGGTNSSFGPRCSTISSATQIPTKGTGWSHRAGT